MTAQKLVHNLASTIGVATTKAEPVWIEIVNGAGPVVVLTGGIHGDEYEAQIVLRQLAEDIDPAKVRGRIVIVPVVNYPAAHAGQRVSPEDSQNMNRVFPGQPDGTPTERIAHWLTTQLFPQADLLIDVHAGGRDVAVVPMVFGFSDAASRTGPQQLINIMRGWGYGLIQHMDCVPGTICHAALQTGLASVEIEGGGGTLRSRELGIMRQGILNGLVACGVLVGDVSDFDGIEVDAPEAGQIYAPTAGLVEHLVALGASVEAGQTIAVLHPLGGSSASPTPVQAPVSGILLRQTQHAWLAAGKQIGNVATIRS